LRAGWQHAAAIAGLAVLVGVSIAAGCEKESDFLGRGNEEGRMSALSGSPAGSAQPVSYEAQNPRPRNEAGAANEERATAPVRESSDSAAEESGVTGERQQAGRREGRTAPANVSRAIDRGAAQVIGMMREALRTDDIPNFRTSIAIRALRNQSRTSSQEIEDLRDRLVSLLDASSDDGSLTFTREVNDATEYTLGTTVYLIQRDGFDQWEMYFALRPIDANWTIWRNEEPVRMLRQRRPNGNDSMQVVRAR
jgi:hypothetical protein